MPWPAGGAERLRAGRGDALAARGRHRRPADRGARAGDLRQPRRAPARDLAGAGAGRPRRLHRAEPLRALGAARRDARSASAGPTASASSRPCCASTASRRSAMPRRSTRRRRTASSGCRPRISGSGSAGASTRGSSPAPCWWRPPSRSTPARRPAAPSCWCPGPFEVLEGLTGPKPEPVAAATAAGSCRRDGCDPGRRARTRPGRDGSRRQRVATLPSLCYHRDRFRWGRGPFRATIARCPPAGDRARTNGRVSCPARLP